MCLTYSMRWIELIWQDAVTCSCEDNNIKMCLKYSMSWIELIWQDAVTCSCEVDLCFHKWQGIKKDSDPYN
jgi:hypothetical protein